MLPYVNDLRHVLDLDHGSTRTRSRRTIRRAHLRIRYSPLHSDRCSRDACPKGTLAKRDPTAVKATDMSGEPIVIKLTRAPGNWAEIGGLKVVTANGWFAARPSETEHIYKIIYAESF